MSIDPWILVGLLVLSVILTLLTNWLVTGRRRPTIPHPITLADVVAVAASALWIVLIFFAGIVAARYIERVDDVAVGYLVFALAAGLLSWIRALLYRHAHEHQGQTTASTASRSISSVFHIITYLLFALVAYLVGVWVTQGSAQPVLMIPLCIGALLPELDSHSSTIGRLLPFVSRRLERRFGRQQEWRTLAACTLVALITTPLILLFSLQAWALVSLGFLSHLVLDLFTPRGVMLFWPLSSTHISLLGGPLEAQNTRLSQRLLAGLAITCMLLIFVVDIGPPPPAPVPSPSYEQNLERYYSMRGNNLVYASVEGTWQGSGRRVSATFEILNALGDSYIMLDRYGGKVFTAGRNEEDNLYLNRVTLQRGPSTIIKPVELSLRDERLADALPTLYDMQREPGLQHIYASGDIVVTPGQDLASTDLRQDYAQTGLRRVQAHEPGHYSLSYLTASDLIALSSIRVMDAELLVVATYASPASGPTVTPLPVIVPAPEPTP